MTKMMSYKVKTLSVQTGILCSFLELTEIWPNQPWPWGLHDFRKAILAQSKFTTLTVLPHRGEGVEFYVTICTSMAS